MNIDRVAMTAGGEGGVAANAGVFDANAGIAGIFAELLAAITEAGTGMKKDTIGDDASASAQVAMAGAFPLPLPLVVPPPAPASDAGTDLSLAGEAACAAGAAGAMQKMVGEASPVTVKLADKTAPAALPVETGLEVITQPVATPAQAASAETPPATATPAGIAAPAQNGAAAPLTVSFSPKVDLQAPKAAASAVPARAADRGQPITGKPAVAGKAASSAAPSVTFERGRISGDAAMEIKVLRMPAPPVQDMPEESVGESALAPAELVAAAPAFSLHSPAVHTADKPLPATPAAPLHPAMQQVMHRVEKAIERGEDTIKIELRPASLGHVEVQLRVAEDGRVAAAVTADRSDTLAVLQQDSARLEQALRDAGLRADAGSLSFSLREGNGQGDAHQRHGRGNRRNNGGGTFAIEASTNEAERTRAHLGALDLRI